MERLDGVKRVEKGFRGWREVNTVTYDPEKTTVQDMEKALRDADTYRRTLEGE